MIRCREIAPADFGAVADFLTHGFPGRSMQMIYCQDVADYVACAGVIGRFLPRRCRISLAPDANGHVKDLAGFYREPLGRKYFKGPQRPRLADLSDTELVIYGP